MVSQGHIGADVRLQGPGGKKGDARFLQRYLVSLSVGRTSGEGGEGAGSYIFVIVGGSCDEVVSVGGDVGKIADKD